MDFSRIKEIEIFLFETSDIRHRFLMSYRGRNFAISESTAQLIEILKICDSFEEAAVKLTISRSTKYTASEINVLCEKFIAPIIGDIDKSVKNRTPFLWRIELLSEHVVALMPRYLRLFFIPQIMSFLVALIIIAEILFFTIDLTSNNIGQIDVLAIAGILLLFVCSSVMHEFGHAAASSYYGAAPKAIGLGLYINFPVFYTDVSDIWKLTRKQRILVNLGGVYFQCLFLLPLLVIYFITWSNVLKYFIITVNLNFILTLNPFFKFDGYWIMSDLLGVPNLSVRSKELFRYYWDKLRGQQTYKEPYMLTLKRSVRAIFIAYSVVVNLFFLYYFCYIMPKFLLYFIENFPRMAQQLVEMIAVGQSPSMQFIMSVFGQLVMMALIVYMLYKMIKPLAQKVFVKRSA